jgi:hypothetical protein
MSILQAVDTIWQNRKEGLGAALGAAQPTGVANARLEARGEGTMADPLDLSIEYCTS